MNLILSEKEIGAPHVKTKLIEIEGADGSIDLTDFFGEPKYGDVTHRFTFSTIVPRSDFLTQYSRIKNALHGRKLRIVLDDDPGYYYVGRCHVSSFTNEKNIGKISIDCECEPYKYKAQQTVVSVTLNGTQAISLTNSRKRAVPTITASAPMTIVFGGGSWAKGSGTFTIPELELVEGENYVTVTGTGDISFAWTEGDL
ncbi:MAG: hypothetical protein PUD16_04550 [bacterium]|nr:hypothetical protein [bacterium]